MFEIDGFQRILDTYAAVMGDPILLEFARLLVAASRESDVLCHYATARFTLLAVETTESGAIILGSRLLDLLGEKPFFHATLPIRVTASAGVASMPSHSIQSMEQMLDATETALLEAQRMGGDQLVVYEP